MLVKEALIKVLIRLQEDLNHPEFWTYAELLWYLQKGYQIILNQTFINLKERVLPLYPSDNGEYYIPFEEVSHINRVYFGNRELDIKEARELDFIDADWRSKKAQYPEEVIIAVLYGGNYDKEDQNSGLKGSRLKTYKAVDNNWHNNEILDRIRLLYDLMAGNYMIQTNDSSGGFMNFDLAVQNGEGEFVRINLEGFDFVASQNSGIIIKINGVDIKKTDNILWISYIPKATFGIYPINYDLQLPFLLEEALIDYVLYECFSKEGESQDINKSKFYLERFYNVIYDYRVENYLWDKIQLNYNKDFLT